MAGRGAVWGEGVEGSPLAQRQVDVHSSLLVAGAGYTVLVCRRDGQIERHDPQGLYDCDTRVLSRYGLLLDGAAPADAQGVVLSPDRLLLISWFPRPGGDPRGPRLPEDVVEAQLLRRLGRGMLEQLTLINHSMATCDAELVLDLDADFEDLLAVRAGAGARGDVDTRWSDDDRSLVLRWRGAHAGRRATRALRVRLLRADSEVAPKGRQLAFRVRLAGKGRWTASLVYATEIGGAWREPEITGGDPRAETGNDRARRRWAASRTRVEPSDPVLGFLFERAAEDLFALRLEDGDPTSGFLPEAGWPFYPSLEARDALTASWQAALLGPEALKGTLRHLAALQGARDDPWREEEPGKLIHEVRHGPLSELGVVPHGEYYGALTSSSTFVFCLSELWHWTGDRAFVEEHMDVARRAIDWARRYGDSDGDDLLEYAQRSPKGLRNHGWKDSDEGVRHADGSLAELPIAPVEEQAYHVIALERMAELELALGDEEEAARLEERARRTRQRVHDAYWLDELGFYAMAIDGRKRPVKSVGSNPGHLLAAGLVPRSKARQVAERMFEPDLFSGWGVRTLSTEHPSYNPFAYHLGTVWPVESSVFVLGLRRYGLDEHADRLADALFDAAASFHGFRLPELMSGHARGVAHVPLIYPRASSPQAWSAGALLLTLQALLGIYPFAPASLLTLTRPRMPKGIESLTLRNLRVGDARVTLRFVRGPEGRALHEVLERQGTLHVVSAPPPGVDPSDGAALDERFKAWALRRAPGRTAHLLRLAMGHH